MQHLKPVDSLTAPTLETERLLLRPHRLGDFEDSAAMWADPKVVEFISGVPSTTKTSWDRLLRYRGHWSLLGFGYWVLEAKADGRFVGEAGFADFKRDLDPPIDGVPEAGWALRSAEFGKGYASEALARIVKWADEVASFDQSFCLIDPRHNASLRLAYKVGFDSPEVADLQGNPALLLWRTRPAEIGGAAGHG